MGDLDAESGHSSNLTAPRPIVARITIEDQADVAHAGSSDIIQQHRVDSYEDGEKSEGEETIDEDGCGGDAPLYFGRVEEFVAGVSYGENLAYPHRVRELHPTGA